MPFRNAQRLIALLLFTLPATTGPFTARLHGEQAPQFQAPASGTIASLLEPGEGLAVRGTSSRNGLVTFAASSGRGLLLPGMAAAPAAERALAFADYYGKAFGLAGRQDVTVLTSQPADAIGQEHVRLRQTWKGLPVTAGEIVVHLRGDRVVAANGRTTVSFPESAAPAVTSGSARDRAAAVIGRSFPELAAGATYSDPQLEVFDRGLIDEGVYAPRLAWFIEATNESLREFLWVDAERGMVLLHFSQIADAKNRQVYNLNHGTTLPGPLVRSEGQAAVADADSNQAYDFAGITYDYYLANHGRDSYDNAGASLKSSVHYDLNYQNAFWNGTQMVYGDGFTAADDVVGHELTHAVTEHSANLFYYNQSGALNESYSDIFGETIDQLNVTASDVAAVKWRLAEDLSIGAIRDMRTPTLFSDPGKMSDPQLVCVSDAYSDPNGDGGGVHSNSGIPNHAYALMVDGGTYNGRTITGIGLTKAAKIQYRSLTTYLTSGSGFADNATALSQSCSDLIGTVGITAADCTQVANAVAAVEMANPLPCASAPPLAPPVCPAGSPVDVFSDNFEGSFAKWTATSTSANQWLLTTGFAGGGTSSAYGEDVDVSSDHKMTMTNAVTVPANGRMYFKHAFEFEHSGASNYDAGVLEYSTNGTTWLSAQSLIDAGATYGGVVAAGNALAGQQAFVRSSFGYTSTRLNLASLAGQNVRFRFRVGTDSSVGSLGWVVDDARIYSCSTASSAPVAANDSYATPFATPLVVAAPGVLGNDNANGGGTMTAQVIAAPGSGALLLNANGSFTYTPNSGFSGADSFTYRAVNGGGPSNTATVTITVGAASGVPPTTNSDTYGTAFGVPLTLPAPGVLINDAANGGTGLVAALVTSTTNGALSLATNGGFTYTPNAGFSGSDSFTYRAVTSGGIGNAATVTIVVAGPGLPLPPSNVRIVGMQGNLVTLAWTLPTSGVPATSLQLEGGIAPGTVLGVLPLGVTPAVTLSLPTGSFYLRLRTLGGGLMSPPSNEILAHVNVPVTPSPAANLLGMVNGNALQLAWTPTFAGGAPAGAVLDVSGPLSGSLALGPGETFSYPSMPNGTFTFSIRQSNAGGPSTASNPVTLTFPSACTGAPQPPATFIAYKSGGLLYLLWEPPTAGAAPASYVLDVTGAFVGSLPMGSRSLTVGAPGGGSFTFAVRATNACGSSAATPAQTLSFP